MASRGSWRTSVGKAHAVPASRAARLTKKEQERARRNKALELKLGGYTYDEIAQQCEYGHRSNARRAVETAKRELRDGCIDQKEWATHLRLEMVSRAQRMIRVFYTIARAGDPAAAKELREWSKEIRVLLAMDAPQRVEVSGPDGGPIVLEQVERIREAVFKLVEHNPELGPKLAHLLLEAGSNGSAEASPLSA